jgi:hypothetical protein
MNASPPTTKRMVFLPERAGETDSERRLREALNRHCGNAMAALDAALALRTAPQWAQKTRHLARDGMTDFCARAMLALAYAEATTHTPSETKGEGNG